MKLTLGLAMVLAVAAAPFASATAQTLDPASTTALEATVRLLQDPAQRGAAIAGNPQATAVDQQIQSLLATPELQEEFYGLVAAVFSDLLQSSGGDASQLTQTLASVKADPEAFLAKLSSQTVERLRAFAAKIPEPKP